VNIGITSIVYYMAVSLSLHILGIVFWAGGLIYITRLLKAMNESLHIPTAQMLSRCFLAFVIPGLALALGSGIYQLLYKGLAFYFKETHWFHAKATLLVILIVVTVLVGSMSKRAALGELPSRKKAGILHGLSSGIVTIIIFLTFLSTH